MKRFLSSIERAVLWTWVAWAGAVILAPLLMALGLEQAGDTLYALLGVGCHQDPERSLHLFGEALGVCHRCSGIGLGVGFALIAFMALRSRLHLSPRMLAMAVTAASIVLVADVLGESNSTMRVITGVLFGAFGTMGMLVVGGAGRMAGYVLLITPLLACAGTPASIRRNPLRTQYNSAQKEALWQSAVVILQEQNYPIQVLDEKSGTITTGEVTGFMAPCNDGGTECLAKESVSLTISPTGTMIVNVNRQVFLSGYGIVPDGWSGVHFQKDVGAVESRQQELGDLILSRINTQTAETPASAPVDVR